MGALGIIALGCVTSGGAPSTRATETAPLANRATEATPKRLAFVSTRTGTPTIFVAGADGAGAVAVTPGEWPSWSPDGRRLAFSRTDGTTSSVYVIDAGGGTPQALGEGTRPSWSPDGTKLVFVHRDGLATMNRDGTGVATLLRHDTTIDGARGASLGKPVWSPTGRAIAFERYADDEMLPVLLFLVDADGTHPRRVTPKTGRQHAESDPAWSPDGASLALWSYGFGVATIAVDREDAPHGLGLAPPGVVYGARPTWSHDGARLAFTRNEGRARRIFSVARTGGEAVQLVPDATAPAKAAYDDYEPAFSP